MADKLIKTYKPGDEWMSAPATWNAANNDIIINAFSKDALERIQRSSLLKGEVNALIHEVAPTIREKIALEKGISAELEEKISARFNHYYSELPPKTNGHAGDVTPPTGSFAENERIRKEQQNDKGHER